MNWLIVVENFLLDGELDQRRHVGRLHESVVGDEPDKTRRGMGDFQSIGGADAGELFCGNGYEDNLLVQNVIVLRVDEKGNWDDVGIAGEIDGSARNPD